MIKGSLVPNITIFDQQGAIDEAKTKWHMDWMFKHGVDGLFLTGSYGLGPLMSHDERVRVCELAREVADHYEGKVLIPHVGDITTDKAVALAKAVEQVGVDAVGAVPPFYYKHTEPAVLEYYRSLIESVDLPVFAYNNPTTTRFTMSFGFIEKLQAIGLAGLKDSPLAVGFLSRIAYDAQVNNKDFQVIIGSSTGWLPYCHMGVQAVIAGMSNYAPEIITLMLKQTFAGDMEGAAKTYTVMMHVSKEMHFTDSTIATHMAMYGRGFDMGYPREPMKLPAFDDPKYKELGEMLKRAIGGLGLEMETGDDTTIG